MSLAHCWCDPRGSTERPTTFTPRFSNSLLSAETRPSSVVQTGVKSFGCENSTPHPLPRYSWKLIVPSVVSAVKFGASSPSCSAMAVLRDSVCGAVIADESANGKRPLHGSLLRGLWSLVDLRDHGVELL